MKQDKNFTVRLKASVEKRLKESGLIDMAIEGSCNSDQSYSDAYRKFMELLDDVDLRYLQTGQSSVIEVNSKPIDKKVDFYITKEDIRFMLECDLNELHEKYRDTSDDDDL